MSESTSSSSRRGRGVVVGVAILGLAIATWMHIRGMTTAAASEAERIATWTRGRARFDDAADKERTRDALRSVAGAVLDLTDATVPGADVALVDLTRFVAAGAEIDFDSAIPDACIEARTKSDASGMYRFGSVTMGPKAVLATHDKMASFPRWVCRVLDGVPIRAFDIRVLPRDTLRIELTAGDRAFTCCAVYNEHYLDPSPTESSTNGTFETLTPAGARPPRALVEDVETGARKLVALHYVEEGLARGRVEFRWVDVPAPGVADGDYRCEVDDLDNGLPDLATLTVRVRESVARIPVLGGRTAVTVRTGKQLIHARIEKDEVTVVPIHGEARDMFLAPDLGVKVLAAAHAGMHKTAPLHNCQEDRLALIRQSRSRKLKVAGSSFHLKPETAVRFPALRLQTQEGTWLRATSRLAAEGVAVEIVMPRPGVAEVSLPWGYSWARLDADDGTVLLQRAQASGVIAFRGVPLHTPFTVQADEGPFGWNRYALRGGYLRKGKNERIRFSRASERPRLSSRVEIFGFVRGPTNATGVNIFCQPADNPRNLKRTQCKDSPFFGFVLEPGKAYSLVAWPFDEPTNDAVQYLKTVQYGRPVVAGEVRRVDLIMSPGRIQISGDREGDYLGLVGLSDERESVTWRWMYEGAVELRNVPAGTYQMASLDEMGRLQDRISEAFEVLGAGTPTAVVLSPR